jgi:hypothetical protein
LWTRDGTIVDLNPAGFTYSTALATNGVQQIGTASTGGTSPVDHAYLWSGTAVSGVDLNPPGFTSSIGSGMDATQQVGNGYDSTTGYNGALLWSGTAASAVELSSSNLPGITDAIADGVGGSEQVGYGQFGTNLQHALLWNGPAAPAVDLNPTQLAGFTTSMALATDGTQQVGYGSGTGTNNDKHALLWSGTAASAVDLNPTISGIVAYSSVANDTNGIEQVGYAGYHTTVGNAETAIIWNGTAASAFNLGAFLPTTGTWGPLSQAYTIDANGNIFGQIDGGYDDASGFFAVEWSPVPVPEPTGVAFLLIAAVGLLSRRRGRTQRSVSAD